MISGSSALIGLITKRAILIVEFANHVQRQGASKLDAVKSAASTRLRPIIMTTAATVLGHFPLVLVTGTFFTLIVLPILYQWLASDHSIDAKEEEKHALECEQILAEDPKTLVGV